MVIDGILFVRNICEEQFPRDILGSQYKFACGGERGYGAADTSKWSAVGLK
jgi:hypothetical protein